MDGNTHNLFEINPHTGEITVVNNLGLDMTNVASDLIKLTVQASINLHFYCYYNYYKIVTVH